MSELMNMIMADSVKPVEKPLKDEKDELAAELLAMTGTATGASRASNKRVAAQRIYHLANAYASVGQKRAALFRGRVKYKIFEMREELRARRLSLACKAAETYNDLMDSGIRKKRPEVAAMVAKDTLHGVGFFSNQDQGGASDTPQLDGDQLAALAERTLQRRNRRTKVKTVLRKKAAKGKRSE